MLADKPIDSRTCEQLRSFKDWELCLRGNRLPIRTDRIEALKRLIYWESLSSDDAVLLYSMDGATWQECQRNGLWREWLTTPL